MLDAEIEAQAAEKPKEKLILPQPPLDHVAGPVWDLGVGWYSEDVLDSRNIVEG
jgi:hypothetical protein